MPAVPNERGILTVRHEKPCRVRARWGYPTMRKLIQQLDTMGRFLADAVLTAVITQGNTAKLELRSVAAHLTRFAKPAPVYPLQVLEQTQPSPTIIAPLQHSYTDSYPHTSTHRYPS